MKASIILAKNLNPKRHLIPHGCSPTQASRFSFARRDPSDDSMKVFVQFEGRAGRFSFDLNERVITISR